jgi:filamentous hemagglutinin
VGELVRAFNMIVTAAQSGGGSGNGESGPFGGNGADTYGTPPNGASPPPGEDRPPEQGQVRFGSNSNQEFHVFRHLENAGLDREAVKDAIERDLSRLFGSLRNGLYNGRVTVNGVDIDYAAFKFPDGRINVGRITPPR